MKLNDKVLFAKVKPDAKIPTKREEDGCYDIYACFEEEVLTIKPHEIVNVPTGIATAFDPKYRFDCSRERGSTGSIGLAPRCGQIDSGYRGEWFLKLQNTTDKNIVISKLHDEKQELDKVVFYPYAKAVCQAALEIVPVIEIGEISFEELQAIPSERGKGVLGSSGK